MLHPTELGIIAGSGFLPLLFAQQARQSASTRLVAVAFHNETDPKLAELVDSIVWLRVGQLSKLIAAFKSNRIAKCVMLGQIAPKNLFDVRPDLRALALLLRIKEKNAHTLFAAIADELLAAGVRLIEPTPWLWPYMPGAALSAGTLMPSAPGPPLHLGKKLTPQQRRDLEFGYRIAKATAALDIGQTVVVKNGVILAIEAFEGTDACLTRAGALAPGRAKLPPSLVAVKVAKENHDMRFDIPCIGSKTVQTCINAGIAVLAIEAGKTLLLDREQIEQIITRQPFALMTVGNGQ